MSEDSSQSLFSKLKNLVNLNSEPKLDSDQPNDEQIQELIENVLKIKGTVVKEIMIPEINISSLNETQNLQEIISVINETRHSRYPVYDENNAKVIGILHVKDLIEIIGSSNDVFNINELIREVKIVPETKYVTSMLEDFKKDRAHLAMVIDEYGMLVGLITIEDILEEVTTRSSPSRVKHSPILGIKPISLSMNPPKLSASGQSKTTLKNSSNFSFSMVAETINSFSFIFMISSFFSS